MQVLWHGLRDALLMTYDVGWALVFGFLVSAIVQAWVPRARIRSALGGSGVGPVARATGLGAASSSCSYAAVAIARSLFLNGASATSALAFQIASTNLVWELGLVLWTLIGWQFTLGEYLGGLVMIGIVAVLLRLFLPGDLEKRARVHARSAEGGHVHHVSGAWTGWRQLTRLSAWSDVARNFLGDWQMLWREIAGGLLLAGFVAQLGNGFLHALLLRGGPPVVSALWGALVGPLLAVLTFVCSVGNVPLAAVLWSGGLSFAGVLAFIFADLLILPIIAIYRKYYGGGFALRITALLFVAIAGAALAVDAIFALAGIVPSGTRPSRAGLVGAVHLDYKLVLDLLTLGVSAVLLTLSVRSSAKDPTCGMRVDRSKALTFTTGSRTMYFCSEHCLSSYRSEHSQG